MRAAAAAAARRAAAEPPAPRWRNIHKNEIVVAVCSSEGMFDKKHTDVNAELSVHAEAEEVPPMTPFAAIRLFAAVLAVSVFWTVLGLTLYGAAVFSSVAAAEEGGGVAGACGTCLWQYALLRVCLVAVFALMMIFALTSATSRDNINDNYYYQQPEDDVDAIITRFVRQRPKRTGVVVCVSAMAILLLLGLVVVVFSPASSALHRCAFALFGGAPALCIALGLFIHCDVSALLLAIAALFVARIRCVAAAAKRLQNVSSPTRTHSSTSTCSNGPICPRPIVAMEV